MASKILKDEMSLKRSIKDQWSDLTLQEQEDLVDDYLVDQCVREKYCQVEKTHAYKKSFPKLKVETGEKIIVDFENDVSKITSTWHMLWYLVTNVLLHTSNVSYEGTYKCAGQVNC